MLNNKTYTTLKYIALIVMPALATLCFTVFQTWGLENGDKVAATITAVGTVLGVLLGVSSNKYNTDDANFDGYLHTDGGVDDVTGHPNLGLTVTTDPSELLNGKVARLKIMKAAA